MALKNFHHPFEPYEIQQQFMEGLYECIEQGQVGIFESPTGTGKSLSLICGSLTWLREHKRSAFQESLQSIEIDGDEPEWMVEHARQTRRKEALQLRADFEQRLAQARLKDEKLRQQPTNSETINKKRKRADERLEGGSDVEDQFVLEDYESDDHRAPRSVAEPHYSAKTSKLLDKLGLLPTKSDERQSDEDLEELKIFICSRTHSQLSQFVGELRRVRLPPGLPYEGPDVVMDDQVEELRQISLGSRKTLCINSEVTKLGSQTAINERCLELQQSSTPMEHKCPFIPKPQNQDLVLNLKDHALATIRDIEDLAGVGKRIGICPYYASRSAIGAAEVVTLPYSLLLQKSSRQALGISLKGHVVIIDEAHNLMDAVEATYSSQISERQLQYAKSSMITYLQKFRNRLKGSNRAYVTQIVRVIDSLLTSIHALSGDGGTIQLGSLLAGKGVDQINVSKLVRYISESKIARKVEGYISHLKSVPSSAAGDMTKTSSVETPTLTLTQNFLIALMNPSKEGRFIWSRDSDSITLRYLLLDPSEHFRDVVESARAVILAGGTMSPMEDYVRQLFPYISTVKTLSCGHIIPPSNLIVRAVSDDKDGPLHFNYKTRANTHLMKRLGAALLAFLHRVKGGAVVFFTSYAYLDQIRRQWEQDGTLAQLGRVRPFFFDSRDRPAEETFAAYSNTVHHHTRGALLLSVIGGKLSEGINFTDDLGRCVVVVGLPYPNLETPEWRAKLEYLENKAAERGETKGRSSREHAENFCMRAVNQAIGRAIRHKGDWASILLVDGRYADGRIQAKLPRWIRESLPEMKVQQDGKVDGVCRDIAAFFNSRTS